MTSVEEFIATRISIETLAGKIAQSVEDKTIRDSKENLEEANRQLEVLKTMVANDVQVVATGRLSRQLAELGTKVGNMAAKTVVRKAAVKKVSKKAVRTTIEE